MKTVYAVFAAAAYTAVIASGCTKYDLNYASNDSSDDLEITFQLAPLTRAATASFSTSSVFQTNAFYHPQGSKWTESAHEADEYISRIPVSWTEGAWRMSDPHCWPSDGGRLTFYSWSLNRENLCFNPESAASVGIDSQTGVHLTGFDISLDSDLDFLVASACCDKSRECYSSASSAAVTTQFRHQLSKLSISARTAEDYSASKEFGIQSVCLRNVAQTADYQQCSCESGEWGEIHRWTSTSTYDAVYGDYSAAPASVSASEEELPGEHLLYIPQTFSEGLEQLEVSYTIRDRVTGFTELVTECIPLSRLVSDGGFRNGVLYSICLTFSLDTISWAPGVADWDNV